MQTIGNPGRAYIIASVKTPAMTAEQAEREHHARIRRMVNHYGIKQPITLEGTYKGEREPSMAVDAVDWIAVLHLFSDNQESVLFVGEWDKHYNGRLARLVYVGTGDFEDIGIFHQAQESLAIGAEAYTHDPATGNYYMVA